MELTHRVLALLTHGADWILWILIALSVCSVSILIFKTIEFHFLKSSSQDAYTLGFQLNRGLDWLGIIGNQAPFIGLLGTVMGIIQAFQGLALREEEGLNRLMQGIAEALVTTGVGLFVAIVSLSFYHFLSLKKDHILFQKTQKSLEIQS